MFTLKSFTPVLFLLILTTSLLIRAMDIQDFEMEGEELTQPLSDEDNDQDITMAVAATTQSPQPTPSFMRLEQEFFSNNIQGVYAIASLGAAFTSQQLVATATRYEARENDKTIIMVDESPLETFDHR